MNKTKIYDVLAYEICKICKDINAIDGNMKLKEDLNFSSMRTLTLIIHLEDRLGIEFSEEFIPTMILCTVDEIVEAILKEMETA